MISLCLTLEAIATAWFTFDYLIRLISSRNTFKFIKMTSNVIDLIANFPFYLELIFSLFSAKINHRMSQTLRVFQTLRLLRLGKNSVGIRALANTLKKSRHDLFLMILVYSLSAFILSSLVYMLEHDEPDSKFDSIPTTFYWAIITMSTVNTDFILSF